MSKMYECISSFELDKVDEDGFVTEEFITIECGEVFELVDSNDFSVKLENEEGRWMIIENELFEYCFEEVENPEDCEVIGNIFDNPDLLEESHE